jgi:DHA3 family macrolide efflux protein-like MFS transporter
MRSILQKKALRFVFAANIISMIGSGMNAAAVAWFILQATHSEIALGTFAVVQTLPAILLLPFTGVIIDREDRRRLVMMLDAARAVVILTVSLLAFAGKAKLWELYLMNTLVAAGFWMFWPTITALIQELTPGDEFIHANTFLLAGVQGGWLIAGAIVGFVYNKIGLGGVLLIDFSTYVVSFLCYFAVRKGRHVVPRPAELHADIVAAESAFEKFFREMREGIHFLRGHREIVMIGLSWALFLSAMVTGVVVTPPLSEYFHAGAVRLRLAERWLGRRGICQRILCTRLHQKIRRPPFYRDLAWIAGCTDDRSAAGSGACSGSCDLCADGLGSRDHRGRDEYNFNGADSATFHG